MKKIFYAVFGLLFIFLLAACELKSSLDGRWESPEYKESMRDKLEPMLSAYDLDIDDYYKGGSSAIVIDGNDIRYETRMDFDLRAVAKVISKESPYLGAPEDIEKSFFNPSAKYDAKKKRVTEIIFEGVINPRKKTIKLTQESHLGLGKGDMMTYEVKGQKLTISGNGYTHEFIKK